MSTIATSINNCHTLEVKSPADDSGSSSNLSLNVRKSSKSVPSLSHELKSVSPFGSIIPLNPDDSRPHE